MNGGFHAEPPIELRNALFAQEAVDRSEQEYVGQPQLFRSAALPRAEVPYAAPPKLRKLATSSVS